MKRLFALLVLLSSSVLHAAQVEWFSPEGEVKGVRQVTARFDTPMVPFGDPRLVEPFDIDCPAAGSGRWADGRNWVYDFDQDLPAGVRCSFKVRPGTTDLQGDPVEPASFAFSTGGPAIRQTLPWEGSTAIDESQVFLLGLDAPATEASVSKHAWCDVTGRAERIPVRVVAGAERKAILDRRQDFLGRIASEFARGSDYERFLRDKNYDRLPLVLLACKSKLPFEAEMRLVWGAGIETPSGVATTADQALAFQVRPAFTAKFTCERTNANAGCIPVLPVGVDFSAPVSIAQAERIVLEGPKGEVRKPKLSEQERRAGFVDRVTFAPPLPEATAFRLVLPEKLTDDAGRALTNARRFPLTVKTDPAPPLVKFAARFGILELNASPALPLTVRAVEKNLAAQQGGVSGNAAAQPPGLAAKLLRVQSPAEILSWLRRLEEFGEARWESAEEGDDSEEARKGGYVSSSIFVSSDATRALTIPRPGGERDFEVIGIPFPRAGFYVVEVVSPKLGQALLKDGKPYYVSAGALVTNLAVHFKWGRESSLAWVTTLDQGKPAAGVQVLVQDCGGKVLAQGVTDASGLVRVRKPLPPRDQLPGCRSSYDRELFVTARRGMDVSFTFSNWNDGIAPWRFNVREGGGRDATIATTVFDRTLLRAGDTVGMKHLLRVHTSNGFQVGAAKKLPTRAILTHGGSDQRWELPLEWDTAAGVAESTWAVPKDAKTGTYSVLLAGPKRSGDSGDRYPDGWTTGSFRVEEFRVPVLKAQLQAPVKPQVNVSQTEIGLQLGYLSGGAAGYQRVKLRSVLQPKAVIFADHDGVGFANGDVRVGREESGQRRWAWEATEDGDAEVPEGAVQDPNVKPLATRNVTLDGGGAATVQIGDLPKSDVPRDLVAEMEYADPNGEILTRSTRVALWPARVLLGIKPDGWALSKDKVKLQVIAVDTAGHVVSGVDVKVDVFERRPFSHRKRLIGGFYAYEYGSDVQRLGDFCSGTTDDKGRVFCEAPAPVSGNLILRAKARDADGNDTVARSDVWVTGDGDWWFDVANDDRMDVLPERKRYEPGETATFQVRAPFRSAAALVTVEREGVIDGFVTTLSGKSPVVHVPLKGNYAPNAFVSVFAVRGRVADVPPTALVDLGKPAFRMGLAEILVGWKAHELAVTVRPSAEIFRTRDRVKVAIDVKKATGGAPGKGAEVALAAVDEALLELMPNESWKLLDTMMAPRGLEVQTATAAMQVVGRRHYGRKALPAGGGGGRQTSRELFDTLLLWKARVKLDAAGHAEVEVPLNDSLSSFRIVAVATAGSGLFGTGQASVRTSQDLMLLSGLPPLVREQDRFAATFTVRNASARPLDVKVDAAVTAGGKVVSPAPEGRMLSLEPGAAQDVTWQIVTPVGTDSLQWQVNARETGDGDAKDGLKAVQKVIAAVPVRTFQATLLQLDGAMDMPVARPADAIAGRGGIAVDLKARLGDELAGVREWMERYPYSCLEQRASVAVALEDESRWKWLMAALPAYLDRDGLAKYFPMMTEGSDTLTAYLLAVADESGWQIPETSRNRMLNGLTGFVTGSVIRHGALPTADLAIRKVAALDAMARHLPAIDPELLGSFSVEPDLWPTSAVIDWWSLAKRWDQMPERDARKTQAERILRSRLNFQGTTMGFSTERTDFLWWLMVSGDVNANRALLALMEEPKWKDDLPRMVRGAVGRQQRGAWNTTVANAWGALALRKFSSVFESEPVTGTSQMAIGNRTRTQDWAKQGDGGQLFQEWPRDPTDLRLTHDGSGKPWVTVRSLAAIPLKTPLSSGYRITRQVQPVEGANLQAPRRGDVWRVSISVEAQSDMTWVVVNDPIPAGAGILGTGLGGDSATLTTGEKRRGWVWPAFEERTFDSFRAYYRFVPKGTFTVEYTVRLHNAGSFELPPTRVEALYAPEMFGEIPNERVVVKEP